MTNKAKLRLQKFFGILALVFGTVWFVSSLLSNEPPDELLDPAILFFNGLLILADLAIGQSFSPGDNEAARSNTLRRVASLILPVLALVIVSVSIYRVIVSVSTYGWWGFTTQAAWGNLVPALATLFVVLFPLKKLLSQLPHRRRDYEARREVLSRIQIDVTDNWKPELIPTVTLPIKFSLRPDLVHPSAQLEGVHSTGSIVDVYDSSGGRLLVLGEAGTGKTTFGLEIINAVAIRAQSDLARYPIPIWLRDLSTWRIGQSFDEWIISELSRVYRVPDYVGATWIYGGGNLTLVLDGLEEIGDKEVRRQFINIVNDYAQDYTGRHTPVVMVSRTEAYIETEAKLDFTTAVEVHRLTTDEIIHCLEKGGPNLAYVRQILEADPDLFELARQPLWLGLISSAYAEENARKLTELKQGEKGEIRSIILDHYIQRRWNSVHMDPSEVKLANRWLGFIATKLKLKERSKNIFFVDELDTNWLETFTQRAVYALVTSILAVVLGIVVAGIAYTVDIKGHFINEWNALHGDVALDWNAIRDLERDPFQLIALKPSPLESYSKIFRNEILAFIYAYIYFFIVWQSAHPQKWRTIALVHGAVLTILTAILAVATILSINSEFLREIPSGISSVWSWSSIQSAQNLIPQILVEMISGLYLGLLTAALTGALMIGRSARAKHTIGRLEWSWSGAVGGLKPGFIVVLCLSVIIGIVLGLLMWLYRETIIEFLKAIQDLQANVIYGITLREDELQSYASIMFGVLIVSIIILVIAYSYIYFALYIVPTCFLLYGQQGRMVASRSTPDHALREWTRNSFYALLVVFGGSAFILLLHNTGVEYAINSLDRALTGEQGLPFLEMLKTRTDLLVDLAPGAIQFGLPFGVAAGLTLGGRMLIKHYVTRAILFRWKLLPKDVAQFLDQTTSLKITKRSSGGYTFYHDFVRDYFTRIYQRDHHLEPKLDDSKDNTRQQEQSQSNRSVAS